MDLTFSTEERLSILRVMWDVSISDGHLAASEIADGNRISSHRHPRA